METPRSEDPNKITINEQNFQKVGEMKSEPTDLKHAPKNYDLYQDVESGSLMGVLPNDSSREDVFNETKIKKLDEKKEKLEIDLSNLSIDEMWELVMNENIKIFGNVFEVDSTGYRNSSEEIKNRIELKVTKINDKYFISPKEDSERYIADFIRSVPLNPHLSVSGRPFSIFTEPKIEIRGRNDILVSIDAKYQSPNNSADNKFFTNVVRFSFYEIPEGYTELMAKKEVPE